MNPKESHISYKNTFNAPKEHQYYQDVSTMSQEIKILNFINDKLGKELAYALHRVTVKIKVRH
jgi:hypothetical protein